MLLLISLVTAVVAIAYIVRTNPLGGLSRLLAPDTMAIVMLGMIFAVRPLLTRSQPVRSFYGIGPTPEGLKTAMTVGIVCMLGVLAGVFLTTIRPRRYASLLAKRFVRPISATIITARACVLTSVVSLAAYVIVLTTLVGRGVIGQLQGGRAAEFGLNGVPEIVLVIPLGGTVAAGLFFISRRGDKISRTEYLTVMIAILASLVMISQLGNRRFLIPAVLIPVLAALIRKPVRVRLWHMVAASAAFVLLAIIPSIRSAGARLAGENLLTASFRYFNHNGLGGVIAPVFASHDTEMLDYIAVMAPRLGGSLIYGLGRGTLVEFISRPLPQGSAGGPAYSDVILQNLQGGGCGQPSCPVASVAGILYFDGGLLAVAVGAVLFGILVRHLSNLLRHNAFRSDSSTLGIVIVSSFALIATRTNTVHATWWCLYTLIVALVISRLFTGHTQKDSTLHAERLEEHASSTRL